MPNVTMISTAAEYYLLKTKTYHSVEQCTKRRNGPLLRLFYAYEAYAMSLQQQEYPRELVRQC